MSESIEALTRKLAAQLSQNGQRICTAESCTGGLIAKTFTDLAGSSDWFDRGFVTYSNQAKIDMLGVKLATLEAFGAVSEQTVGEMAQGAIANSRAQFAIAVSGVAGPGGGSPDKPVGTVWFGFASPSGVETLRNRFDGDRDAVRQQSLRFGLLRLLKIAAEN